MSEATPRPGADIDAAAAAFEGLLDAPAEPSEEAETAAEAEDVEAEAEGQAEEITEDAGSEDAEDGDSEEETAEADEDALTTAQFAELVGVDEGAVVVSDDGLKFKTKVDGEEGEVSLRDLIKSYQLEGHVNKRSMELAEQRKAIEAERDQARQAYEQRIQQAESLVQSVEQSLLAEYNAINWQELRETDPAEFAAKRQEFAERAQGIEQAKAQTAQGRAELTQEQQRQHQERLQAHLQKEAQALYEKLPEWTDEGKRSEEQGAIRDYLKGLGYNDQEIAQAYDHRLILMARDAMQYRKMRQAKPTIEKKVTKAPRVVKPGAKKDKAQLAAERNEALNRRLKKSGSVEDAAALFFQDL